jgi:uncharacterized RDD family membrane protein YckC
MNASNGQSLKGHYAGFASRTVAVAIDLAIISVVTLVVTWASLSLLEYIEIDVRECPPIESNAGRGAVMCLALQWTGIAIGVSFPWIYALFFWTVTGQTPGKAVMGVRIVRLDGRPMTLWTSIVRLLGYGISLASAGLGFLLVLSDDRRQALHDKLPGTCVIYSWDAYGDPNLQKLFPRLFG